MSADDEHDVDDEIPTSGCIARGTTNLDPPCDCVSKYSLRSI